MKLNVKIFSFLIVLLILISGFSIVALNFNQKTDEKEKQLVPANIWTYQNQKIQPTEALVLTFQSTEWEAQAAAAITPAFIDRTKSTPIIFNEGLENRNIDLPHNTKPVTSFGSDVRTATEKIAGNYWSQAELVIITDSYENTLRLVPIASFLTAPILVNPSSNVLQLLSTKCIVIAGEYEPTGDFDKIIRLKTVEDIWSFQLDLYKSIEKECNYIIVTNPNDASNDLNSNITWRYLSLASAPLAAFRNAIVLTGDYTIDRIKTNKLAGAGKPYEEIYSELKPAIQKVKKETYKVEKYMLDHGHVPEYLALVGGSYAVPDYIFDYHISYFYWSAKTDYLFSPSPYGDIDDRLEYTEYPKQEVEVGRLIGHSLLDVSLQITKTIFYEDFLSNGKYRSLVPSGWEKKASVVEGHRVNQPNSGGPPLSNNEPYFPAGEIDELFSTSGYQTNYYLPRNVTVPTDDNTPINAILKEALNSSLVLINAHGGVPGKQALIEIGLDTDVDYEYNYIIDGEEIEKYSIAPSIVYLIGCDTGSIAFDFKKDEYLTLGFIHSGAVAYLAPETYQTICFWEQAPYGPEASQAIYFFENLIKQNVSIGNALLEAKWKAYQEWESDETREDDVGPNTLKLYGDPAFKPSIVTPTNNIEKPPLSRQSNIIESRESSSISLFNATTPLTLSWDDTEVITGTTVESGNLTIKDFGRLVLQDAELTVNGFIKLEDYGSIFAINSKINVVPENLHENTSILNLSGKAIVRFIDSELSFEHSLTPIAVPFVKSEGEASLLFINGTLNVRMPPLPRVPERDYDIEERISGIAGVMALSEDTYWEFRETVITVNVKYETINDSLVLMSSWYMGTILGNAELIFDGVYVNYNRGSKLLEPIKGKLEIRNSLIIGGFLSTGLTETNIINSTINGDLFVSSRSTVTITDTNFNGNIINGIWAETEVIPESKVIILDSIINKDISCGGNTVIEISNSTVEGGAFISENGTVRTLESSFGGVIVQENLGAGIILNSTIKSVFLKHGSTLYVENIKKTVESISIYFDYEGEISLINSKVKRLTVYTDCDFDVTQLDSSISRIDTSWNSSIDFKLINSNIDSIVNSGDNNNLTLVLKNSTIPEIPSSNNFKTEIKYQMDVSISLNKEPIETTVEIYSNDKLISSGLTDDSGNIAFPLSNEFITPQGVTIIEDYTVKTSFMGFSDTRKVKLNNSKEIDFAWTDFKPPEITKVTYDPKAWNSNRQITVRASAKDAQYEVVSNVSIVYSTNGGSHWKRIKMQKIDANTYEGIIPGQHMGTDVQFYVESYDRAGNLQETEQEKYLVGQELLIILYAILVTFICFSLLIMKRVIGSWRTKRLYFHKYDKSSNVIIMYKND
jgi:hypothetical protein